MNGYLIPANTKRSMLILGLFNQFDLILFATGLSVSLLAFMLVPLENTFIAILAIMPGLISGFLVIPIPYHHNVLTILTAIYKFYTSRQNYVWKGWCFSNEQQNINKW